MSRALSESCGVTAAAQARSAQEARQACPRSGLGYGFVALRKACEIMTRMWQAALIGLLAAVSTVLPEARAQSGCGGL